MFGECRLVHKMNIEESDEDWRVKSWLLKLADTVVQGEMVRHKAGI